MDPDTRCLGAIKMTSIAAVAARVQVLKRSLAKVLIAIGPTGIG